MSLSLARVSADGGFFSALCGDHMTMKIKEQADLGKTQSLLINRDYLYTCRHMYREATIENIKHNIYNIKPLSDSR